MTLHETPDIPETKQEFRNGGFIPVSKENAMTDLEKLLAEATPEQLASALLDAEERLARIATARVAYDESALDTLDMVRAIARSALARIDAIMGERDD